MPSCVTPVRAMIDAYDRYFGDGTGEAFFMGPYLDVLPAVVNRWVPDDRSVHPSLRNDIDHAHGGRIDQHDLIVHQRILHGLGRRHRRKARSGNT